MGDLVMRTYVSLRIAAPAYPKAVDPIDWPYSAHINSGS